jgi:isopentenyl phosphate kinase
MSQLVFLKLGGSLITDKRQPESPRADLLAALAQMLAELRQANPDLQLVLGHGSGSFGHVVGRRYGTRQGVRTATEWYGFAATADAAARLNRIVVSALLAAEVPAWAIQPSVVLRSQDGRLLSAPSETIRRALAAGLLPVVYGDVTLDDVRGGTIASTEEIFERLAADLQPQRIILAGEVDGVYTADPNLEPKAQRIPVITPASFAEAQAILGGSHGVDVTGGMAAKVAQALALTQAQPGLEITICSGVDPDHLRRVLVDPTAGLGTRIYSPHSGS